MKYVKVGKTEIEVSVLGFGAWKQRTFTACGRTAVA